MFFLNKMSKKIFTISLRLHLLSLKELEKKNIFKSFNMRGKNCVENDGNYFLFFYLILN